MIAVKLVAVGTGEHAHVDVTRAAVEALMAMRRELGYEGQVVGSRSRPDFTVRFYGCDANIGGWAVLEESCPFPFWRLAEQMASALSATIQIVTLQVAADGKTQLSSERLGSDGSRALVDEESFDDEPVESIAAAEGRLVAALDLADDRLHRSTWGYVAVNSKKRRKPR